MHPAEINALIKMAGSTQADIARSLEVSQAAVSHAVNGHFGLSRIRRKIAETVNRPVEELWPPKVRTSST